LSPSFLITLHIVFRHLLKELRTSDVYFVPQHLIFCTVFMTYYIPFQITVIIAVFFETSKRCTCKEPSAAFCLFHEPTCEIHFHSFCKWTIQNWMASCYHKPFVVRR